jgi:hypothetical protein
VNMMVSAASLHCEQSGSQCIVATATLVSSVTISGASEELSSSLSLLAILDSFTDLTTMAPCRPVLM